MADLSDLKGHVPTLLDFAKNPVNFIRERIVVMFAGMALSVVYGYINTVGDILELTLVGVFGQAGYSIMASLSALGMIPIDVIVAMNDLMIAVAQSGGLFAPVVYVVMWAAMIIVAAELARFLWRAFVVIS